MKKVKSKINPKSQKKVPYVGPQSFKRQDKEIFFGRDPEAADIFSLIIAHRTLVLYAQSGAGKTSLINAGVIPLLEAENFEVFPVTRVRGVIPEDIKSQKIPNIYVFNSLMKWEGEDADPKRLSQISIANFLSERKHTTDEEGNDSLRIVIFDPFEELFSLYPERWKEREGFFSQIAEAIEADPLLRILFVIREDDLASLISYADLLPGKLRIRYGLERLSQEGACQAVEGPLRGTGCSFAEGVASSLVQKLLNIRVESTSGEMIELPGEYVEPVQLQVVCQKLWESLKPDETAITYEHLRKYSDVDEALRGFYENAINLTRKKTGVKEKALREWFNKKLITPDLTRGTVFRGKKSTEEIPNSAVDVLDHQHIIRAEITKGARWYELTHDRLIEPVRKSNDDWFTHFRKDRARDRILQGAIALVFLSILVLGIWSMISALLEYKYTTRSIKKLRSKLEILPQSLLDKELRISPTDKNRRQIIKDRQKEAEEVLKETEKVLNNVALYLWKKQDRRSLAKLMDHLQNSEDLMPERYGVDIQQARPPPSIKGAWPLQLEYSNRRGIDRGQLHYHWLERAKALASEWGIAAPMRLKLVENENLPINEMYIRVLTAFGDSQDVMEEAAARNEIEERLVIHFRSGHVFISEDGFSDNLRAFFYNYKKNWTQLEELKRGGPWWLVPRWTLPLWKVAGQETSPKEAAVAFALFDKLLEKPELVLTQDCVKFLLKRLEKTFNRTINEALAVRGGIDNIRKDLVEIVRQGYPLTNLRYLLDKLANYPSLPPYDAVERVIDDMYSSTENFSLSLSGRRARPTMHLKDKDLSGGDFQGVYEEVADWLPTEEPEIRVYLGSNVFKRFVTSEYELTPEVLEALAELQGDIYKHFGIILFREAGTEQGIPFREAEAGPGFRFREAEKDQGVPFREAETGLGVRFREAETGLAGDSFRIEILNQTKSDEDAQPINVFPDKALERFLEELHSRYMNSRQWWLTAEKVDRLLRDVPKNLRTWLESCYTLTDLKLILRAVIEPSITELNIKYAAEGSVEDVYKKIGSDRTLCHLTWLLGSLSFWINVSDPLDIEQISSQLRETHRARLTTVQKGGPFPKTTELVKQGIEALKRGKIDLASGLFKKAVKIDHDAAVSDFLSLYSQQSEVTIEGQLARLGKLYSLPAPGKVNSVAKPKMQSRYELEDFLSHFGRQTSQESMRKFQLYLIWSYITERHYKKSEELLNQLLLNQKIERWTADEEYFLAYLMLDANMQAVTPPERLGQIQNLLLSVFERWSKDDLHAELAFRELRELYTKIHAPNWYWSMLESLADLHKQNYWISYMMGSKLAVGVNLEEGKKALAMLDRAESNLLKIKPNDRTRMRAWLNLHRAQAYLTLVEYGEQRIREQGWKQALKLLTSLIDSVQPDAQGWPPLYWVYRYIADAYIWANNIEQAVIEVDKGLHLFPNNQELLYEKFFLHLVQIQTSEAVKLAQELQDGPRRDETNVLFLPALAQLLTGKGEFEYAARRFINTTHSYRDYIRMMLYWSLCGEGKDKEAKELLIERWKTINPLTWGERMEYGDQNVWREMLMGYYVGKVDSNDIFGTLQDRETFERSPLRRIGFSFSGIRCEAHFYNALLQGVSGDPETRRERQIEQLKMALDTQHFSYYEYHMANYLINIIKGQ